jgi:hypothetical protein
MKSPFNHGRRDILRLGSCLLTAATARALVHSGAVSGAELPKLDEKDAQAQALGYRHDAAKVDHKKYATYQSGQACGNCQQFQGKAGADWAPCTLFPGKDVNAKGWCSAWVKKAGGAETPLKG